MIRTVLLLDNAVSGEGEPITLEPGASRRFWLRGAPRPPAVWPITSRLETTIIK